MKRNQNENIIPEMLLEQIPNDGNGVTNQKYSESDSLAFGNNKGDINCDINRRVHFKALREDVFRYLYEQEYGINDRVNKAG